MLQFWMKEHKRARTNGEPWRCTLAEFAMNHRHNIALEDATVVDANPPCTNVEQLKRGTSTRSPDQ